MLGNVVAVAVIPFVARLSDRIGRRPPIIAGTRVTAMDIAQNLGTTVTAVLPALFAAVAPPGSSNVPLIVGAIAFAVTVVTSLAAWTTRETFDVPLAKLGNPQ